MDGLVIDWIGGNCPVQAEGTIDNKRFYFRARGSHWEMRVGLHGTNDPFEDGAWGYSEDYGDGPYDAGWMPENEALAFIQKAAELYRGDAL